MPARKPSRVQRERYYVFGFRIEKTERNLYPPKWDESRELLQSREWAHYVKPGIGAVITGDGHCDALRGLLHEIGQSVQGNVDSDHTGYVRRLMGCVKVEKLQSNDCSSVERESLWLDEPL